MVNGAIQSSEAINTPAIITGNSSSQQVLASNTARIGFSIQNVGTTPAFICVGAAASGTVFHQILKGGTGASDGLGASWSLTSGAIPTGVINFYGDSSCKVVAMEIAP